MIQNHYKRWTQQKWSVQPVPQRALTLNLMRHIATFHCLFLQLVLRSEARDVRALLIGVQIPGLKSEGSA